MIQDVDFFAVSDIDAANSDLPSFALHPGDTLHVVGGSDSNACHVPAAIFRAFRWDTDWPVENKETTGGACLRPCGVRKSMCDHPDPKPGHRKMCSSLEVGLEAGKEEEGKKKQAETPTGQTWFNVVHCNTVIT